MAAPTVRMQTFPNNEVRVVYYWKKVPTLDELFPPEKESETLLDITSKLKNPPPVGGNAQWDEANTPPPRPGYGGSSNVSGFTLYGRRKLLRAGAALDCSSDSPQDVIFLTGTLPGSTYECKKAIADWSAYAVNLLQAWIAIRVPQKLAIYCWEFQKRGALHIHYAVHCPDRVKGEYIRTNWKAQWGRIIDAIGQKAGVDMWRKNANFTHANDKSVLQADAQWCTKSIANYLAKYVSKSQQQYKDNHWKDCKPSRYWGVSRPLNAILKDMTTSEECTLSNRREWSAGYEDCLSVMRSHAKVSYDYGDKFQNAKVVVGYANPGELAWLANQVRGQIMRTVQSSSKFQSEVDLLYLRIVQAVKQDEKLRNFVLSFSDNRFFQLVEQPGSFGLDSLQGKTQVILDYRWYILRARRDYPSRWARHSQLIIRIQEWYESEWVLSTTQMEKRLPMQQNLPA
jgi:hypothetical protein